MSPTRTTMKNLRLPEITIHSRKATILPALGITQNKKPTPQNLAQNTMESNNLKSSFASQTNLESGSRGSLAWLGRQTHNLEFRIGALPMNQKSRARIPPHWGSMPPSGRTAPSAEPVNRQLASQLEPSIYVGYISRLGDHFYAGTVSC